MPVKDKNSHTLNPWELNIPYDEDVQVALLNLQYFLKFDIVNPGTEHKFFFVTCLIFTIYIAVCTFTITCN